MLVTSIEFERLKQVAGKKSVFAWLKVCFTSDDPPDILKLSETLILESDTLELQTCLGLKNFPMFLSIQVVSFLWLP